MDTVMPVAGNDDRRLPATAREAREILQSIRIGCGYLDDKYMKELEKMNAEAQQTSKQMAEDLRRKTAKYITSIAGELYSTKTRFICELLQNADDSSYSTDRDEPRISISLHHDRILFDTNETGFTIANVKAICDVGESSKKVSAADKSIGEKGYGFKSVFAVAYRARIQSGLWSFYFEHHEGDNGLGMITPVDTDPDLFLPAGITTRIELLLHKNPTGLHGKILRELTQLPETTIFFLQKIRALVITTYQMDGSVKQTEIKNQLANDQGAILDSVVSLSRKDHSNGSGVQEVKKLYNVCERTVTDMPADKHRKDIRDSLLKLAFPFDPKTRCPKVNADGEQVFAYLPLYRKPHLPFLIQGDFVTTNSRQSVLECAWNDCLLENVADEFCDAIRLFYQDEILRYQWLKYLPVSLTNDFEAPLLSMIKERLQDVPVFETWKSRSPARSSELRILPASLLHKQEPLFEDLPEEAYLAPEYSSTDHLALKYLGITPTIKVANDPASDPWHEACSSVLASMLSASADTHILRIIKGLKIIPLRSSSGERSAHTGVAEWVSAVDDFRSKPIYFTEISVPKSDSTATRNSLLIPRGLPIQVVHQESQVGPQRRKLLAKLGVTSCAPHIVVNAIFELHRQLESSEWPLALETLVSHLQYLFWFRDSKGPINLTLFVASGDNWQGTNTMLVAPVKKPFYMQSDNPYDAWSLLKDTTTLERDKLAAFISDEYMSAESKSARSHGSSWVQWLEQSVQLRRRPPLLQITSGREGLSSIMLHVLKNRPTDFIPTLQAHWASDYQITVAASRSIKDILSLTKVQCERTSPTALSQTYMPTTALKAEAKRIGIVEHIPFLKLPGLVDYEYQSKWAFLSTFGVGSSANLDFYLDLLFHAQRLDNSGVLLVQDVVARLYTTIGALCNWDKAEPVKQRLMKGHGIYVPSNAKGQRWKQPSECLWTAPSCITVKSDLAKHYGTDKNTSTLFRTYLQIYDVHASDYLDQLRYFKRTALGGAGDRLAHADSEKVYQELYGYQATSELWENIRQAIDKEKLVFANYMWHSPSECLWSKDASISDQVSIGGIYANLKEFFVSKLRVKVLTTAMLVSDLKRKAEAKTPLKVDDAKVLIFKINNMLANDVLDYRLQGKFNELESVKCFPVRSKDGFVNITDAKADFAIVDRERFGKAFGQDADLLDFSLDEVHILRPFIEATNMTDHYLSQLVKEVSEIEGSSTQSPELTSHLQGLAYALFCCAVHYKSTKIFGQNDSLFQSLLCLQVHEAEKMGTSLVLKQGRKTIRVPSSRIQLKIEAETNPWKMYVPKDIKARKACYSSQVPRAILELLNISEGDANTAMYRLINEAQDHEGENSIMEQYDVLPISWITWQTVPPRAGPSTPGPDPLHASLSPLLDSTGDDRNSATTRAPIPSGSSFGTTPAPAPSGFNFGTNSTTPDSSRTRGTSPNANASPFGNATESSSSTLFGGSPGTGSSPWNLKVSAAAAHTRSASATPLPTFSFGPADFPAGSLFAQRGANSFGGSDITTRRSVSATPSSRSAFINPVASTQLQGPNPFRPNLQRKKYKDLLENIIKRVSGENHAWNLNDLADALPEIVRIPLLFDQDETFGVRNEDHLAHDIKIGAAGEVFVFEKLMTAKLPQFNRNNWLSTIRSEAKVLERYEDMPDRSPDLEAGSRAELADIVYSDPKGKFAEFLETQDCVGNEEWLKTQPALKRRYFIEVKTTTRGCDTAFYMSTSQHARMLEMRKKSFIPPNDVYIICRVYNLLSNDIAMRWYISPGRDEGHPATNVFNFGLPAKTGAPSPFSGDAKPILKFTSRSFEVRPVR